MTNVHKASKLNCEIKCSSWVITNQTFCLFILWLKACDTWFLLILPLSSISRIHMSTTMGRVVLWALTSVVRSQLNTFFILRRSGWQSLGTSLEHCLCTFSPQSRQKESERRTLVSDGRWASNCPKGWDGPAVSAALLNSFIPKTFLQSGDRTPRSQRGDKTRQRVREDASHSTWGVWW